MRRLELSGPLHFTSMTFGRCCIDRNVPGTNLFKSLEALLVQVTADCVRGSCHMKVRRMLRGSSVAILGSELALVLLW